MLKSQAIAQAGITAVLDTLQESARNAVMALAVENGLEPYLDTYSGQTPVQTLLGKDCFNCGRLYRNCTENLNGKGAPCCGACKSTNAHSTKSLAALLSNPGTPSQIGLLVQATDILNEIKFPTLEEEAREALAVYAKTTGDRDAILRSADVVAQVLIRILENKEQ